ncbi:hypothetical protein LCGC14_2620660 [marine sediment metagenome]|uniref:Uncharacterized protein n=1 Tax=marine sediment metagenome TaxID=412755 RepID=A0A0F9A342_9ZZZZ
MPRKIGISTIPYTEIVNALNSIKDELSMIKEASNVQTKYLELLTRKYSKKLFKRYFGRKK